MKFALAIIVCIFVCASLHAQVIVKSILQAELEMALTPEHGFLPGKAFRFYPTLDKFDFGGKKLRVELIDERDSLHLIKIACSETGLTNQSEFAGRNGAGKVADYFDTLFKQANIIVDSSATDILTVHLQALDNRLLGFGSITAHGLCQMLVEYKGASTMYCEDITDKSPHSPISSHAFVTRKTGSRVIQSASIREVIEQILVYLKGT